MEIVDLSQDQGRGFDFLACKCTGGFHRSLNVSELNMYLRVSKVYVETDFHPSWSSSGLVDSVAGFERYLSTYTDPPV